MAIIHNSFEGIPTRSVTLQSVSFWCTWWKSTKSDYMRDLESYNNAWHDVLEMLHEYNLIVSRTDFLLGHHAMQSMGALDLWTASVSFPTSLPASIQGNGCKWQYPPVNCMMKSPKYPLRLHLPIVLSSPANCIFCSLSWNWPPDATAWWSVLAPFSTLG